MMNMKQTKRALLSSVLALFLCFTMLLGTTFAWFTDSVTSTGNIIQSGSLNVEMYYADGTRPVPVDGANDRWLNADGATIYSANQLWEPGYTDAKHIKISNEGTLALKYQLAIIPTGEVSILADVIDVYYIESATQIADRTDLANYAPVGTLRDVINRGIKHGNLSAKTDYTATIVLAMRTDAGNEYQDKSIGDGFTIQLLATQYTAEDDSFDDQYDAGSPWLSVADIDWYANNPDASEFEINTPEQLAGLAAIVNGTATVNVSTYASTSEATTIKDNFAGQTIKLTGNVDLNNVNWTPIGSESNPFKGVFDGGNFTISNLAIQDPDGDCVALFGFIDKTTVKNIKIHNVNIHGLMRVAAAVGATKPGAVIDNVHVSGDIKLIADEYYAAGIVTHGYVTVKNCSVVADVMGLINGNGGMVGGICGWRGEGATSIENCHVKNMNMIGRASIGGLAALIHYNNTVSGCSVENVTLTKTRVDGWGSIGALCGNWGGVDKAGTAVYTVTNNTIKNVTLNGTAIKLFSEIYGSKYSTPEADMPLVESGNTFENITNNMVEVTLITPGVVENNGVKQIFTAEGLNSLGGTKINGTYELLADLDMTGIAMKPMEISGGANVTFIGNGHTISNLTLGAAKIHGMTGAGNEVAGLFDLTAPATTVSLTVSDLAFENVTVACSGYAAVVAGYNSNGGSTITLNNVDVKGATVTSDTVAALIGYTTGVATLTDCDVSDLALTGEAGRPDKVGALVGTANQADCVITANNCTNATAYNDAGRVINGATWKGTIGVGTLEALQKAINEATGETVIALRADITGDVTVVQKPNVKITIDGNNKTFAGSISIDGKSASYSTAGIKICNVNFDATAISADASINMGIEAQTAATRYVANLTVENCTFTGNYPATEKVGIKTYTGGGQNLTVTGCTATNMHSLAQIHNVVGVKIEDCSVVGCKNGIGIGASRAAEITNCDLAVVGYGIRCDANEVDSALTISDCKIDGAYIPVVIRKAGSASCAYTLTIKGENTITNVTNNDGLWCAAGTNEYGDVDKAGLTVVKANVVIDCQDTALDANGIFVKR